MINHFLERVRRLRPRRPQPTVFDALPGASAQVRAAAHQDHWALRPAEWEMLSDLFLELRARPHAKVMMLVGNAPSPLGRVLEQLFPDITMHRTDLRATSERLHTELASWGPYDMIIDDSRMVEQRKRVFCNSWYHLDSGGVYVVRDIRADPWPAGRRPFDPVLRPLIAEMVGPGARPSPNNLDRRSRDEWHRADSLAHVKYGTEHLIMESKAKAFAKMREDQMNQVITNRANDRAKLINQLPAVGFISRARLDPPELLGDDGRFKINFETPPMSVRSYRDALVLPHQIAIQDNLILPESYRHNQRPRLTNRGLHDLSQNFATIKPFPSTESIRQLPGRYFHLDAEWRQHYGHLLTEQLSRLWAWPALKHQIPELKAVISLKRGHDHLEPWEQAIFSAAGIDPEDIAIIDAPTKVEELIGATPMLSAPDYIDPRIETLWNRVGDALRDTSDRCEPALRSPDAAAGNPGGPIFVTRPPTSKTRPCHNQAEVEDYFRNSGFQVIQPELHPVSEQLRIFDEAPIVAGFAGSAMFNLMFRRDPVSVVLLRPSSYTSVNEYLISAVRGNTLTIIDSVPDKDHPANKWSWEAFYSGFTFDFDREGRRLHEVLDQLRA
jgi:capsular polysaccharide biosynthesis protein